MIKAITSSTAILFSNFSISTPTEIPIPFELGETSFSQPVLTDESAVDMEPFFDDNWTQEEYDQEIESIGYKKKSPCQAITDRPHRSYTNKNDASVHAWSKCDIPARSIGITTSLGRYRWYGVQWLNSSSKSKSGQKYVKATVHSRCKGQETYHYAGTSYHWAKFGRTSFHSNTYNDGANSPAKFSC